MLALSACATQTPLPPAAAVTPAHTASIPPVVPAPLPAKTIVAESPVLQRPTVQPPAFDKGAALQAWVEQQNRLYRVAAPLLINNTELCPRHVRNLLGFTAKTKYSYSDEFVAAAETALGLGERLHIASVLPGSGAATAGLQVGDVLLSAGIEPMPQGPDAEHKAASLIMEETQGHTNIALSVLRNGETLSFDVPLTSACAMVIDLGNSDDVNSYADGRRVMVTKGMLYFVQTDEELAYVLAKEIAHNIIALAPRLDMGAVIDRLRGLSGDGRPIKTTTRISAYPPVADATADKLALYILVRAGYDITRVPSFWKRLATAYPAHIKNSHTALHPETGYRLSVVNEITKTIDLKRKNGLALAP